MEDEEHLYDLLASFETAMLVTRGRDGHMHARPMAVAEMRADADAYFVTSIDSPKVAEIYADDAELRKKITPILRKHMEVENDLDREVRSKIKNLQEGTSDFEIEYTRVMEQIKAKRRLT